MKVTIFVLAFVAGALVDPAAASAQRASTDSSTAREVAEVRAVYAEVVHAIDTRALTRRDSTFSCDDDDLGQTIGVWTGRDSVIRRLMWQWGTDDHAETHWFYYDRAGRLRFHYITFGAVNGTLEEERDYYSADGRLIRHVKERTHGPGYFFAAGRVVWRPHEWLRQLCTPSQWPPGPGVS